MNRYFPDVTVALALCCNGRISGDARAERIQFPNSSIIRTTCGYVQQTFASAGENFVPEAA
jgi:hypothetical protein